MRKLSIALLCCLLTISISIIAVSASSSFFSEIVELADSAKGSGGGGSRGGGGGGRSSGGGSRGGGSSSRGGRSSSSSSGRSSGRSSGGRSSSRGVGGRSSKSSTSSGKTSRSGRSSGRSTKSKSSPTAGRLSGRTRAAGLNAAKARASLSKFASSIAGKFSKVSGLSVSKALAGLVGGPKMAAAFSAMAKNVSAMKKGPRVNSLTARFNAAFSAVNPAAAVNTKLTASAIQASVQKQQLAKNVAATAAVTTTPGAYKIDKGLLTKNEAFSTKGYVPNAGKSGVTVGTGFDIGQQNKAGLKSLGLSPGLVDKLSPYTGLKQQAAKNYLSKNPLSLSEAEAKAIDKAVMDKSVSALAKDYEAAAAKNPKAVQKFSDLPASVQSVAYSVQHQYGSMKKATPNFFGKLAANDYPGMVKELRNFGDAYSTRRNREADHMENGLKGEPQG